MKEENQQSILEKKNGMKVLLVEDNPINQIVAAEMLLQLSVQVTTAENGVEALEFLEKESFDIILMDIQMPKLGGIEATKILREKLDNTPVVAMTAYDTRKEREKCFDAGMNEFLSKPIERESLFSLIDKYYYSGSQQVTKTIKSKPCTDSRDFQLDGVDVADAVKRLNCSYKLFSEILDNFCIFYLNITKELRSMIESGNIDELKREAHSLKGAAANVSAVPLSIATKELDEALKQRRPGLYEALIVQVDLKFKDVVKSNELLKSQVSS